MKLYQLLLIIILSGVLSSCNRDILFSNKNVVNISGEIRYYDTVTKVRLTHDFYFDNKDTIRSIISLTNQSEKIFDLERGDLATINFHVNYADSSQKCLLIYLRANNTAEMYQHNNCNSGLVIGRYKSKGLNDFFVQYLASKGIELYNYSNQFK